MQLYHIQQLPYNNINSSITTADAYHPSHRQGSGHKRTKAAKVTRKQRMEYDQHERITRRNKQWSHVIEYCKYEMALTNRK